MTIQQILEDILRNDYELNEDQIKAVFDMVRHYQDANDEYQRMMARDSCCSQFDPCEKHGGK
jgi:hypothetical protein